MTMKIHAVGAYECEEARAKEWDGLAKSVLRCRKVAAKIVEEGLRNVPSEYLNEALLVQMLCDRVIRSHLRRVEESRKCL